MNRTRLLVTLTALLGLLAVAPAGPAAAATGLTCTADAADFGFGYQMSVSVANHTAAPVSGWTVQFTVPATTTIESRFNGSITRSGSTGTFHPSRWFATLNPGITANVGFGGRGPVPTGFTLDGVPCTVV